MLNADCFFMRFIKYKKYVPEPASEMSMEDLLGALSDYLLQSGFQQQYMDFYDLKDAEQTLDDLRQAIAEALLNLDMLDTQIRAPIEPMSPEPMQDLTEQLIERMEQENYINVDQPHDPRSEEHTSELQSLRHLVCRLLLEK